MTDHQYLLSLKPYDDEWKGRSIKSLHDEYYSNLIFINKSLNDNSITSQTFLSKTYELHERYYFVNEIYARATSHYTEHKYSLSDAIYDSARDAIIIAGIWVAFIFFLYVTSHSIIGLISLIVPLSLLPLNIRLHLYNKSIKNLVDK